VHVARIPGDPDRSAEALLLASGKPGSLLVGAGCVRESTRAQTGTPALTRADVATVDPRWSHPYRSAMPPLESFAASILIGLVLLVMLWFALGTQRNIRKGDELLRWLQRGLPVLGQKTTMRWLGSSAVELGIVDPAAPFREATVLVVLEPRDVGLLWAYGRFRGRRDFMIVRVNLRRPPRFSMDIRDPHGWTGRFDAAEDEWQRLEWPGGCVAFVGPGADQPAVRSAWNGLSEASNGVWRLTVQPVVPHVEVHLLPPSPERIGADRVIAPIRDLATAIARD